MQNINLKYRSLIMNKRDKLIKDLVAFFEDATKSMLLNETETWHHSVTDEIAIVCEWVGGYDPDDDENNPYQQGEYAIEASIRLNHSSYFVADWEYVSEGCMITLDENFKNIAEWLVSLLYECHYINPEVLLPISETKSIDLLEYDFWVRDTYTLGRDIKELVNEWWLYHGWNRDAERAKHLKIWSKYLEEYLMAYEFCDEDNINELSEYITAEKIYQALIRED